MDEPGWSLDELAHAGPEHLDPGYVSEYDRKAAWDPTEDVAELIGLGFGSATTVVDLGAGTGTFALAMAPHCGRLVAVDVSRAMLHRLRARAAERRLPNIEDIEAGFLTYRHQGEPPAAVYSRNALHQLPDFWKAIALRRIAGVLPGGGVLRLRDLVFSFTPAEAPERIAAWLAESAARPEDGWTRSERETHLRDEYSTFSWLLEPMLEHAGFRIERAAYGHLGIYAAYTCVRV